MTDKPERCPFCGEADNLEQLPGRVVCHACGACGPFHDWRVATWNTRANEQPVQAAGPMPGILNPEVFRRMLILELVGQGRAYDLAARQAKIVTDDLASEREKRK